LTSCCRHIGCFTVNTDSTKATKTNKLIKLTS